MYTIPTSDRDTVHTHHVLLCICDKHSIHTLYAHHILHTPMIYHYIYIKHTMHILYTHCTHIICTIHIHTLYTYHTHCTHMPHIPDIYRVHKNHPHILYVPIHQPHTWCGHTGTYLCSCLNVVHSIPSPWSYLLLFQQWFHSSGYIQAALFKISTVKWKYCWKKPYGSVWYLKTTKPKFRYTLGQGTEQVTPGIFWNMDSWMFHVLQKVASRQQQKVKLEQEYLTSRVTSTSMQFPEREPWSTAFFGICDAHHSHVNTLYDFWQNSLIWRT